jgi:hypothetical protein
MARVSAAGGSSPPQNQLLAVLLPSDFALLQPHLQLVPLLNGYDSLAEGDLALIGSG